MDVRSIEGCERKLSHRTVNVWWLVKPEELKAATTGGHLEYVTEFHVAGGEMVEAHSHPSHEFYYVTSGRGLMVVDGEEREVVPGDLVYIPPNKIHSLRPISDSAPINCFSFAISEPGEASHYA